MAGWNGKQVLYAKVWDNPQNSCVTLLLKYWGYLFSSLNSVRMLSLMGFSSKPESWSHWARRGWKLGMRQSSHPPALSTKPDHHTHWSLRLSGEGVHLNGICPGQRSYHTMSSKGLKGLLMTTCSQDFSFTVLRCIQKLPLYSKLSFGALQAVMVLARRGRVAHL